MRDVQAAGPPVPWGMPWGGWSAALLTGCGGGGRCIISSRASLLVSLKRRQRLTCLTFRNHEFIEIPLKAFCNHISYIGLDLLLSCCLQFEAHGG